MKISHVSCKLVMHGVSVVDEDEIIIFKPGSLEQIVILSRSSSFSCNEKKHRTVFLRIHIPPLCEFFMPLFSGLYNRNNSTFS